jgi:hypothetical protein
MQYGGGELAECADGIPGTEDVSEEARRGGAGVLEDFGEEVEGCSADAVERDIAGEELLDWGAADVFGIGAESGESLEVIGGEVGEGMCEGAEVFGGESERSLHKGVRCNLTGSCICPVPKSEPCASAHSGLAGAGDGGERIYLLVLRSGGWKHAVIESIAGRDLRGFELNGWWPDRSGAFAGR